jgi:hypothetical protein
MGGLEERERRVTVVSQFEISAVGGQRRFDRSGSRGSQLVAALHDLLAS